MADVQPQDAAADKPSLAMADLVPPMDDKSVAGLVSGLTNIRREKVATDTRLANEADSQQAQDKALRDQMFKSEGVSAAEIANMKPWDADKEHKKYESNPIEGFGSAGGLFAMVASAFTKAPMENAINGMAGAITAIQSGNEMAYKRAYESYKENFKLAEQRFKTQHELYSDALSLASADATASAAKFHNAAVRFGDKEALFLAEQGHPKELYELLDARAKSMDNARKADEANDEHAFKKAAVDAVKKGFTPTDDPATDKVMLAAAIHRIYSNEKPGTALQEATGRYVNGHMMQEPNGFAEGLAKIYQDFGKNAPNQEGYNAAVKQWQEAHPGEQIPPDENAKLMGQFGLIAGSKGGVAAGDPRNSSQLKIAQIKEIQNEGKTDGKWQTLNEAEAEWKKRQTQPTLSPEDVKKFGEQLATGDTSVLTNIGRGAQSAANVLAVRKAAYDVMEAKGQKPADLAFLNARYQGLKAAERASATQEMKMGAAAWEATNQAQLALDLSAKLPRSRIVPFNKAVQSFEMNTSDPDMNAFASANNTLVNSYVRAISPTGISTDLVRKHAYDMLNTAVSDETYKRVVDVLKQEMRLAIVSPGQMRKQMEAEYKHDIDPTAPAPPSGNATVNPMENSATKTIKYDAEGNRVPGKQSSLDEGRVMSDADPDPVRPGARYAQANAPASSTRSLPTFSLDELRPYRNKEIPPGDFPKVAADNQENRVIVDKSYGNLDEFGYRKVRELKDKYRLKPGEKVLLIDKQGHQFGYQRDDNYEGGFTFWMPYEEQPGS